VRREPADDAEHLLHHRSPAHHAAEFRVLCDLLLRLQKTLTSLRFFSHHRQKVPEPAEIERLRQVVDRPELDRLDGAIDRGVATHQTTWQSGSASRIALSTSMPPTSGRRRSTTATSAC
jgi:hypothetical protein